MEMHEDAVQKGMRVLVHDDLLATGGTAEAAGKMIERLAKKGWQPNSNVDQIALFATEIVTLCPIPVFNTE